jgi:predicted Zn-dependent peptidase
MIHNLKNPTDLSGLYFVYRGSTNLEQKGTYGLAHFGEHLKCKNFDDLQDTLQENGIMHNAYTSGNNVVFYFTGLEKYLAPFRETLIERMTQFNTTEEELVKEKKIVLEEYMDSFTDQTHTHYLNFNRRFYGNYSPIGLREDIENFDMSIWKQFHDMQYAQPDMLISISKDYELKDTGIIGFTDRSQKMRSDWAHDANAILEPSLEYPDKTSIIWNKKIELQDQPLVGIAANMLIGGLNSPLYQEVREKRGLVYYLQCYTHRIGNMPYVAVNTATSDKNVAEVNSVIGEVFANREKYLTQERFEIVKKSQTILREKRLINRYNDISDILNPEVKELADRLDTLKLEEVFEVYDKYFDPSTFTISTDKDLD